MNLNPQIWGSHYWFFLHTITLNYPDHPNDIKIDFSGHIADVNPESIKSNLIMQETKTNDTINNLHSIPYF